MRLIPSLPGVVVLKKFAAALLVFAAWSAVVYAQEGPECRNLIGIYTAPDPTPATAQVLANYNGDPGLITAYVVITNPYNAALDQPIAVIGGFEFRLVVPAGATIVAAELPPLSNNFHPDPDNWLVGTNVPVAGGNAVLLTLTIAEFAGTPGELFLAPVSRYPSIPGNICIADYEDEFSLSAAQPGSGDFALPVFGLYTGDAVRRQAPCGFTTWHVATDGDDAWPGTSLAPFRTIGRGIEAAAARDTVVIADGRYTGQGNRDIDVGGKALTIRSESGNRDACVIDGEREAGSTGWIFYSTTYGDLVAIEGMTMTRAAVGAIGLGQQFAIRDCFIDSTGTGIRTTHGWATGSVTDCRIDDCQTGIDNNSGWGFGPSVDVEACQFNRCGAGISLGGAKKLAADGPTSKDLPKTIRDCEFVANGAGVSASFEDEVYLIDCVFTGNDFGFTGARPYADFTGCTFSGHALAAVDVRWPLGNLSMSISSCEFRSNPGQGVVFWGDYLTIADTQILHTGGIGISARVNSRLEITGVTVAGGDSTAIAVATAQGDWACPVTITSCTVAGNAAGIMVNLSPNYAVDISHTIVAFNTGEGLADSGVTYDTCDIYGNGPDAAPDSWLAGSDGNFARDPLFCDPDSGVYGIAANSPCAPSELHELIGAGQVACAGIPAPVMLAVEDIPADQGGQVRLTWYRSGYDEAGSDYPILGYDVYRRIDAAAAAAPRKELGAKLLGWDYLLRVSARGDQGYQVVAPTLCDSTIVGGLCESTFLVSAVTEDPLVYFDSEPESGYSVDNLAPLPPAGVTASYQAAGVALDWDDAPDADFHIYRIYRDTDPEFTPAEANLVDSTGVSGYDDPFANPWGQYYKITAVDFAGNEGQPGSPQAPVSGVGETSLPVRTALLGATPNPFNPMTRLSFELATPGAVRLRVYDLAGRVVATLVDGRRDAGRYEVVWDGRDDGGRAVSSGVYLYLLDAGAHRESKRMVLVR